MFLIQDKKDLSSSDFIKIKDILSGKYVNKEVKLRGWIYRKREQKQIIFIILRDSSGIIQLACKGIKDAEKATIESSIQVSGIVKEDQRAPGGYEIEVKDLKIIGLAERFPITKDQSEEFLRDMRHLWIRSQKLTTIFKIRSELFKAIRKFYDERGFYEIQSPIFTKLGCEGGSTLFEVKYGDKKGVYLSQSWQLYAEAMIYSLERIFTLAPSFRAEKSRTRRHLSEYWHHEMEAAWITHDQLMEFEEDLIIYIVKHMLKHCKDELIELGRDLKELEKIKKPFLKITYKEAIEILGKQYGHDLTDKDERELLEKIGKGPIFITSFPREMKAFYMKKDPKDPKTVLASDLLLPGVGEVTGGSERISDLDELKESLKIFKLKKEDYKWYIDLRKYGSVPHSGFGLGIERLLMWLTCVDHIMDAIPFPRTIDRVYP
ncbi:MAG: asparagine--tRNA ligase [Candidatus Aenigmarchaeota archaeon]|nr:asparagine--tRNA ligase [Candidatus Aenigmarchaeota archaeon]